MSIQGQADIELGPLEIVAQAGIAIGKAAESITDSNDKLWRRLQAFTPVLKRLQAAGPYPSSGNLGLDLGTPDQGTYWDLESCFIGGVDVNVEADGTAGLYVVAGLSTTTSPGSPSVVDFASGLPNAGFYGTRDCIVQAGEHLLVIIFSGSEGQTYVANASASVFNAAAGLGRDIIAAGV